MKHTITESEFVDAFAYAGKGGHISMEGRKALFKFINDEDIKWFKYKLDDPIETPELYESETELNIEQLCNNWKEYTNLAAYQAVFAATWANEEPSEDIDSIRDFAHVVLLSNGAFLVYEF